MQDPNPDNENAKLKDLSHKQALAYAHDLRKLHTQMQKHFEDTISAAVRAIEAKDEYTRGHTERVTLYSLQIAAKLGFSTNELKILDIAGRMHDIGKIGIPDAVLNKPGALTDAEYAQIKEHVNIGRQIMAPMAFVKDSNPAAFSHHERWDGKGYPEYR